MDIAGAGLRPRCLEQGAWVVSVSQGVGFLKFLTVTPGAVACVVVVRLARGIYTHSRIVLWPQMNIVIASVMPASLVRTDVPSLPTLCAISIDHGTNDYFIAGLTLLKRQPHSCQIAGFNATPGCRTSQQHEESHISTRAQYEA
jgi:hypothetical protein